MVRIDKSITGPDWYAHAAPFPRIVLAGCRMNVVAIPAVGMRAKAKMGWFVIHSAAMLSVYSSLASGAVVTLSTGLSSNSESAPSTCSRAVFN